MSNLLTNFIHLKKDKWYLMYSADIKPDVVSITTGPFMIALIDYLVDSWVDRVNSNSDGGDDVSQQEASDMRSSLYSIVTSDDDIELIEYSYGHGDDDSMINIYIIYIMEYLALKIQETINDPNSDINAILNELSTGAFNIVYNNTYLYIDNEVPQKTQDEIFYLSWVYAFHISNLEKFNSKYIAAIREYETNAGESSNVYLSWYDNMLSEGIIQPYYGYVYWSDDIEGLGTSHLSKLFLDYNGGITYTSYTDTYSTINENIYLDQVAAKNFFDVHDSAYKNDKYFHFKVYSDKYIVYPLPIKKLTISTGSANKVYDSTPLTSTSVHISGDILSGDNLIIDTTGSITQAGSCENTVVYQVTYQQPQRCVYEVTYELGTLTVSSSGGGVTPPPTPNTPGDTNTI